MTSLYDESQIGGASESKRDVSCAELSLKPAGDVRNGRDETDRETSHPTKTARELCSALETERLGNGTRHKPDTNHETPALKGPNAMGIGA